MDTSESITWADSAGLIGSIRVNPTKGQIHGPIRLVRRRANRLGRDLGGSRTETAACTRGAEETDLVDGDVGVYRTDVGKRFSGDIEGTSEAWLVMTITPSGPAAYVGLEVLDVSIGERRGTFVLKHDATATSGGQEAS